MGDYNNRNRKYYNNRYYYNSNRNYKNNNSNNGKVVLITAGVLLAIGAVVWFYENIFLPYIWWFVGIGSGFLVVAICLLIYFKVILKKKTEKMQHYVSSNSVAIQELEKLNKETHLKYMEPLSFDKVYDIKRYYENVSTQGYMEYCIRCNIAKYKDIYDSLKQNDAVSSAYRYKVMELKNNLYFTEEKCKELKVSYKKYHECEIELFDSLISEPNQNFIINVSVRYISKGGMVRLSKDDIYDKNDFFTAFDNVKNDRVEYEVYKRLEAVERALITDELRFEVMKRDNYKCCFCGASQEDGVRLHVDHIIPIAKGGKSVMSNLQTLCESCNMGKSDKLM